MEDLYDDEEDEWDEEDTFTFTFTCNGRGYEDMLPSILGMQKFLPENHDIIVLATKKHQTFPVKGVNYYLTNYGDSTPPANKWGFTCGQLNLTPKKGKIIWRRC